MDGPSTRHHRASRWVCRLCRNTFEDEKRLLNHLKFDHPNLESIFKCYFCRDLFLELEDFRKHLSQHHQSRNAFIPGESESYFGGRSKIFRKNLVQTPLMSSLDDVIIFIKPLLLNLIESQLNATKRPGISTQVILHAVFQKENLNEEPVYCVIPFNSKYISFFRLMPKRFLRNVLQTQIINPLIARIEDFQDLGSNFNLLFFSLVEISILQVRKIKIGCAPDLAWCLRLICEVPKRIQKCMYIPHHFPCQATCFQICVGMFLLKVLEHELPSLEKLNLLQNERFEVLALNTAENMCHWENIHFPLDLRDLEKFVSQNSSFHLTVTHLIFEGNETYLIPLCEFGNSFSATYHMTVALARVDESLNEENPSFHALWVHEPAKMLWSLRTRKSLVKDWTCPKCFRIHYSYDTFRRHQSRCEGLEPPKVEKTYPQAGEMMTFHHVHARIKRKVFVYLDFETQNRTQSDGKVSLWPIAAGLMFFCNEKLIDEKFILDYDTCAQRVIQTLVEWESLVWQFLYDETYPISRNVPFLNETEARKHKCYLCRSPLIPRNSTFQPNSIHRDHDRNKKPCDIDHCSECVKFQDPASVKAGNIPSCSNFIGYTHSKCNLKRRYREGEPGSMASLVFHSGLRFDLLLFLKKLDHPAIYKLKLIPGKNQSIDSFRGGIINIYEILDSTSFLNQSLDSLTKELLSEKTFQYPILKQAFPDLAKSPEKLKLLSQKGVFPYDLLKRRNLHEIKACPPIEAFYNSLRDEPCSAEDYARAQTLWKELNVPHFAYFLYLYLKTDVCLLAEIWFKFSNTVFKHLNLDPSWFISNPGLTMSASLLFMNPEGSDRGQGIALCHIKQLVDDALDQLRGGMAFSHVRFMDADLCGETIEYIDANSLYPDSMKAFLPDGQYRALTEVEIDLFLKEGIFKVHRDSSEGYLVNCDLKTPTDIYAKTRQFPLVLTHQGVNEAKRLIGTFEDVTNYLIYAPLLRFLLEEGIIITKIHYVYTFSQKPIFREYLEHLHKLRTEAKSKIEASFFKSLSVSLFGKLLESGRYDSLTTVRNQKHFDELLNRLDLKSELIRLSHLSENMVLVRHAQKTQSLKRAILHGFCVLDLSKLRIFEVLYRGYFKHLGHHNVQVLAGDTDSFMLSIKKTAPDFPESVKLEFFHPNHSGKFKSEIPPNYRIIRFVSLSAKCYSIHCQKIDSHDNDNENPNEFFINRSKGVLKKFISSLSTDDYASTLFDPANNPRVFFNSILKDKGDLFMKRIRKKLFTTVNNKRQWLSCNLHSIPWGEDLALHEPHTCSLKGHFESYLKSNNLLDDPDCDTV